MFFLVFCQPHVPNLDNTTWWTRTVFRTFCILFQIFHTDFYSSLVGLLLILVLPISLPSHLTLILIFSSHFGFLAFLLIICNCCFQVRCSQSRALLSCFVGFHIYANFQEPTGTFSDLPQHYPLSPLFD